jgi:hypothetical protein
LAFALITFDDKKSRRGTFKKKSRGKYPHRIIYDYIVKECLKLESKVYSNRIHIPETVPIRAVLFRAGRHLTTHSTGLAIR